MQQGRKQQLYSLDMPWEPGLNRYQSGDIVKLLHRFGRCVKCCQPTKRLVSLIFILWEGSSHVSQAWKSALKPLKMCRMMRISWVFRIIWLGWGCLCFAARLKRLRSGFLAKRRWKLRLLARAWATCTARVLHAVNQVFSFRAFQRNTLHCQTSQ